MTDEEKTETQEVAPSAPAEEVSPDQSTDVHQEEVPVTPSADGEQMPEMDDANEVEQVVAEKSSEEGEEAVAQEAQKNNDPEYKAKLVDFDDLKAGMTVRVHEKIKDVSPKGQPRERIQVFEGMIIGLRGAGVSRTMTVRKNSNGGFGVEKIYPINSPVVAKVELVKTARVRQAKLGYLKNIKKRFKRRLKETWVKETKRKKKK